MMPIEITCRELVELVTDYLEGAMEPLERQRLEEHLAGCRPCRHYLEQMRGTIKTVGRLPVESVTPEAQEELLRVFRAWKQG
jgi:predicted anti-sigma-YlaC factor YlaD